ncbi:MAG TPA: fumarate hydratase [bacterium]|nr:fumarate hydratase [bacterium]
MKPLEKEIYEKILELSRRLPAAVKKRLENAGRTETGRARKALEIVRENWKTAEKYGMPLCQDTGIPLFFVTCGRKHEPEKIKDAIVNAAAAAYRKLRESEVSDPVRRTPSVTKPFIFWEYGRKTKIEILLKGGGCENLSALFHFNPVSGRKEIEEALLGFLKKRAINACPPLFIGIGIGGEMLTASRLAYRALLRLPEKRNSGRFYSSWEKRLEKRINLLGIGPQGWGGKTTVLGAGIEHAPSHIANLSLALVVNCHSFRKGSVFP